MAKFCQSCGAPLEDGVKFCTSCGSAVAPAPQPAQPTQPTQAQPQQPAQQPQYQQPQQQYQQTAPQQQYQPQPQYQPQQNVRPQSAPQAKPAKKGKGGIVVAILLVAAIGAVCFFGFREGGFFRSKDGGEKIDNTGKEPTIVYDVKTIESLVDYAKKLEEAGNTDAAAAVYELIAKGGGADYIDEAHRDFPLVSAADEVEEYKGLFEKKGGVGK